METNDPKYAKYVLLVERNLQSFDTVSEWADVIAFLGRLLKAIETYPHFKTIPHKHTLCKRLAQCLNPALPSGVHQKTLEVYQVVLQRIGANNLCLDLPLYAFGLFPFLQHAATAVKGQILQIYETFFLPLGENLKPCLKGFILSFSSALEEENNEHFVKVVGLLDQIRASVGDDVFYQALWLCLMTSAQARNGLLHYLARRLPTYVRGASLVFEPDLALMAQAFCLTVRDRDIFVQRDALDMVISCFPLRECIIPDGELVNLTYSMLHVVLRRDMSLNKRLYLWLLGQQPESAQQREYFYRHAKRLVIEALKKMLQVSSNDNLSERQKPFKILLSLQDKWEVASGLTLEILPPVFESIPQQERSLEVMSTASTFLHSIDARPLWRVMQGMVINGSKEELFKLTVIFPMCNTVDKEIHEAYLPFFLISIFSRGLMTLQQQQQQFDGNFEQAKSILLLLSNIALVCFKACSVDTTNYWMDLPIRPIASDVEVFSKAKTAIVEITQFLAQSEEGSFSNFSFDWSLIPWALDQLIILTSEALISGSGTNAGDETELYTNFANLRAQLKVLARKAAPRSDTKWASNVALVALHTESFELMEVSLYLLLAEGTLFILEKYIGHVFVKLWKWISTGSSYRKVKLLLEIAVATKNVTLLETVICKDLVGTGRGAEKEEEEGRGGDSLDRLCLFFQHANQIYLEKPIWEWFARPLIILLDRIMTTTEEEASLIVLNKYRTSSLLLKATLELLYAIINGAYYEGWERDYAEGAWYSDPRTSFALKAVEQLGARLDGIFDIMKKWEFAVTRSEKNLQEDAAVTMMNGLEIKNYYTAFIMILTRITTTTGAGDGSFMGGGGNEKVLAVKSLIPFFLSASCSLEEMKHVQQAAIDMLYGLTLQGEMDGQASILRLLGTMTKTLPTSGEDLFNPKLTACSINALTLSRSRKKNKALSAQKQHQQQSVIYQWSDFLNISLSVYRSRFIQFFLPILNALTTTTTTTTNNATAATGGSGWNKDEVAAIYLDVLEMIFLTYLQDDTKMEVSQLGGAGLEPETLELVLTLSPTKVVMVRDLVVGQLMAAWRVIRVTPGLVNARIASWVRRLVNLDKKLVIKCLVDVWIEAGVGGGGDGSGAVGGEVNQLVQAVQNVQLEDFLEVALGQVKKETPLMTSAKYIGWTESVLLEAPPTPLTSLLRFLAFVREQLNLSARPLYPYLVRCGIRLWKKIFANNASATEQEVKEKFSELFQTLLEGTCIEYGQQFGMVLKKGGKPSETAENTLGGDGFDSPSEVLQLVAVEVVPCLFELIPEPSRLSRVLTTLLYHIVGVALKANPLQFPSEYGLGLLHVVHMTDVSGAYKIWRKEIWEAFEDASFFTLPDRRLVQLWKILQRRTIHHEKARLLEVLGRISWSSTALFTSREAELAQKASSLRRLSFLLYCGTTDQFLPVLPSIQEKIVDLLKWTTAPSVILEIYLCLRVLVCRTTTKHLSSFWPVLLTEMQQFFDHLPNPGGEGFTMDQLTILLAICKFLDLLFILAPDEFQLFQWMFIADYSSSLASSSSGYLAILSKYALAYPTSEPDSMLRLAQIASIYDLAPFFNRVQRVKNTTTRPDVGEIENLLESDFFPNLLPNSST